MKMKEFEPRRARPWRPPWICQWLRKVWVPKRRVVGMGTLQQLLYALVDLVSIPTPFFGGSKGEGVGRGRVHPGSKFFHFHAVFSNKFVK